MSTRHGQDNGRSVVVRLLKALRVQVLLSASPRPRAQPQLEPTPEIHAPIYYAVCTHNPPPATRSCIPHKTLIIFARLCLPNRVREYVSLSLAPRDSDICKTAENNGQLVMVGIVAVLAAALCVWLQVRAGDTSRKLSTLVTKSRGRAEFIYDQVRLREANGKRVQRDVFKTIVC